jgi:uncharacterized Zn finger protein
MGWDESPFYPASRPRRVTNGLKAKSQRGEIGESWWSKRWIAVLESLGMGARLSRGKSYARQGQVISLDIKKGGVSARVQGSRSTPYKIEIGLHPLSDPDWDKVAGVMASQAVFAAKLLSGEMPRDIEKAFSEAHVQLFPQSGKDLITACSCPDYANPCKHIAAVYFILAENFDSDPFLIFKLRGRTREEIIQALRQKRGPAVPLENSARPSAVSPDGEVVPPLEECTGHFWTEGEKLEGFAINPVPAAIAGSVLKRLGQPPLALGGEKTAALLTEAYALAAQAALQTALGQNRNRPDPPTDSASRPE